MDLTNSFIQSNKAQFCSGKDINDFAQAKAEKRHNRTGRKKKECCQKCKEYIFEKIFIYWSTKQVNELLRQICPKKKELIKIGDKWQKVVGSYKPQPQKN